jgi:hypothetical protein
MLQLVQEGQWTFRALGLMANVDLSKNIAVLQSFFIKICTFCKCQPLLGHFISEKRLLGGRSGLQTQFLQQMS